MRGSIKPPQSHYLFENESGVISDVTQQLAKGALVIAAVVLVAAAAVFLLLVLVPFAIGFGIVYFASWVWSWYVYNFKGGREAEEAHREAVFESRQRFLEEEREKERKKHEAELERERLRRERWADEARQEELKIKRQHEEQARRYREEKRLELERKKKLFDGSFESLGDNVFLESSLPFQKREELLGKGYKRLKISPFGDSGSAFYWIYPRHNESKEHAFFCYLIKALLEVYAEEDAVWMHTTRGPDVVVEREDKTFCFDVETGNNWSRRKDWVKRKFSYYKKNYEKSFIFVTNKKLKFKYSKLGIVVTRATLRKTIAELFKDKHR